MKPWYMKKKIWTAVVTAISAGFGYYTEEPEIAESILILGTALIAAIGLEDIGKSKRI